METLLVHGPSMRGRLMSDCSRCLVNTWTCTCCHVYGTVVLVVACPACGGECGVRDVRGG